MHLIVYKFRIRPRLYASKLRENNMPSRLPGLLLLIIALCIPANAHAVLKSSQPAIGQVVHGTILPVHLTFNSRIDAKRSRLILVDANGVELPLSLSEQPSPDTLQGEIKQLKTGSYVLRWQVLAVDGHITRGEIPFNVE